MRRAIVLLLATACTRTSDPAPTPAPASASAPAPAPTLHVLATGQSHPRGVAVASGFVWFTAFEDGALKRVPLAGGAVETRATDLEDAQPIDVDDAFVYVGMNRARGDVLRVPQSGGKPTKLAEEQDHVLAVAVVGDRVWFTTSNAVKSVPKVGGKTTTIADGVSGANDLAADDRDVFYPVYNGGVLSAAPRAGGAPRVVLKDLAFPTAVVVRGGRVYVACTGDGTIRSVAPDGTGARVVASGLSYPMRMTADDTHLLVTTAGGTVARIARDGGQVTTVATGQNQPEGIAIAGDRVIWAANRGGEVVTASIR